MLMVISAVHTVHEVIHIFSRRANIIDRNFCIGTLCYILCLLFYPFNTMHTLPHLALRCPTTTRWAIWWWVLRRVWPGFLHLVALFLSETFQVLQIRAEFLPSSKWFWLWLAERTGRYASRLVAMWEDVSFPLFHVLEIMRSSRIKNHLGREVVSVNTTHYRFIVDPFPYWYISIGLDRGVHS